ncbi:hypothetical protein HHL11_19605 [Ramlibacter sp. G-1-2-2]|uniref:Uncharacterized protein n=1 Tax=Ramlibacter agri TaxID=2728837 RepID=A0A848HBU1_9BURK|nr:hypothetical protein [Ramlibacter agri]NML45963.1 hypothetical protein [Ramlibacter agri]
MAVLQCGACDRFISVSIAPGGNPVAKADPERWSLTRTLCPGCGYSLCDRCAPRGTTSCPRCKAAFAGGGAPGDEEDAGRWEQQAGLMLARRWLAGALLGSVVTSVLMVGASRNVGVSLVLWVASLLAAWSGARRMVALGAVSRPWLFLVPMLGLIPLLNIIALAWLLWRAQASLDEVRTELQAQERRQAARERAAQRRATAPPPAPQSRAEPRKPAAFRALACIKFAGLPAPDGEVLDVNIGSALPGMAPDDSPVAVAYQGFGVFFAVDEGSYYGLLSRRQLREAELDPQDLLRLGLGNLAGWAGGDGGPEFRLEQSGAATALLARGQFEASLVLLDSLWDSLAPGGVVVAMPAPDVLAFCDPRSREGIAELRAIVQRLEQSGARMLVRELFVRRDGRWTEFTGAAYS